MPDCLTEINGKFCWIFFGSRINTQGQRSAATSSAAGASPHGTGWKPMLLWLGRLR
jgi:hypothetical protein